MSLCCQTIQINSIKSLRSSSFFFRSNQFTTNVLCSLLYRFCPNSVRLFRKTDKMKTYLFFFHPFHYRFISICHHLWIIDNGDRNLQVQMVEFGAWLIARFVFFHCFSPITLTLPQFLLNPSNHFPQRPPVASKTIVFHFSGNLFALKSPQQMPYHVTFR